MTQSQLDIVSPLYGPSSMTMSLSTDRSTFAPSAAPSSAAVSNEHALYLLAAPTGSGVDQASSRVRASASRGILFTVHLHARSISGGARTAPAQRQSPRDAPCRNFAAAAETADLQRSN